MAKKLYTLLVRYPSQGPYDYEKIERKLNDLGGDWLRYNGFTWLFWSEKVVYELQKILIDKSVIDEMIILQSIPQPVGGWSEKWVWEWISRARS